MFKTFAASLLAMAAAAEDPVWITVEGTVSWILQYAVAEDDTWDCEAVVMHPNAVMKVNDLALVDAWSVAISLVISDGSTDGVVWGFTEDEATAAATTLELAAAYTDPSAATTGATAGTAGSMTATYAITLDEKEEDTDADAWTEELSCAFDCTGGDMDFAVDTNYEWWASYETTCTLTAGTAACDATNSGIVATTLTDASWPTTQIMLVMEGATAMAVSGAAALLAVSMF